MSFKRFIETFNEQELRIPIQIGEKIIFDVRWSLFYEETDSGYEISIKGPLDNFRYRKILLGVNYALTSIIKIWSPEAKQLIRCDIKINSKLHLKEQLIKVIMSIPELSEHLHHL